MHKVQEKYKNPMRTGKKIVSEPELPVGIISTG
jgi:hypothetical protein